MWFALIHFGALPPINAASPDLSAPGLLGAVLLHAVFGTILFVGVIAVGLAALSILPKHWRLLPTDRTILSVLTGLLFWIVVCAAVQIVGGGSLLILGVLFGFAALRLPHILRPLVGTTDFAPISVSGLHWKTLLLIYVLGLAFSAHFGLLWRLPSEIANGTLNLGDLSVYVANYHALKVNIYPLYALGIEGEQSSLPVNQIAAILAFSFDTLPGFEISLFLTSSVAFFFFLTSCFIFAQIHRYRDIAGYPPLDVNIKCIIILLLCAATRYPSWIVESPPYAFAFPLGLAIIYLASRGKERVGFLYVLLPLTLVAFAISKIVAVTTFSTYVACCLWVKVQETRSKAAYTILILGAILVAAFSAFMLMKFGPNFLAFSTSADFGPPSLHTIQSKAFPELPDLHHKVLKRLLDYSGKWLNYFLRVSPSLAMDIGLILLPFCAWRLRSYPLLAATAVGVVLYLTHSFLFNGAGVAAFIVMAGWLLLDLSKRSDNALPTLMLSACLLLYCFLFYDPGLAIFTVIWVVTFGGALALISFQPRASYFISHQRHWTSKIGDAWRYAVPVTLLISVFAHAEGDLRFRLRYYGFHPQLVSSKLYDLWVNVRQLTPADALIFTDQTSDEPTRLGGWNDFSLIAERQFYISTWQASRLRGDSTALHEQLDTNQAVISGKLPPEQLRLRRSYSGYFAAIRSGNAYPETFQLIYDNGEYAIYRLP